MGDAKSGIDSVKEELGWLKVLFAVFAAVDASVIAWISQNYLGADRFVLVLAGMGALAATMVLLWLNYAAYRNIRALKSFG